MKNSVSTPPSLTHDVYWPMMQSAALITAGELGFFPALSAGALSAQELAKQMDASEIGVERLCAVLVQTGYLERTAENKFCNSAHAQAWLSQKGESDWNSGLRWFAHAWQMMSGLRDAVIHGKPKNVLWDLMKENPGMGAEFAAYMKDYAASVVDEVQRAVKLPVGAKTLLDVGGSHGLHAAAFCQREPELSAVIFDLPVSLTNTRQLISDWKLSKRIRCVEGNILNDAIEGTFDVITYFLVAHNQVDADNVRIIQKLAHALNPGGVLFVYEYARDLSARFTTSPTEALAAAFDLTLLVETGTHLHTAESINTWLNAAGLKNIQRTDLQPIEKGTVFCAQK